MPEPDDESSMTREAGVEYLRSHGLNASARDWVAGATILVLADPQLKQRAPGER